MAPRHSKLSWRKRNLNEDAILEILLRLPVKSLMRCKCVCKGWNALIGSKSFVKRHHKHESNQERLLIRHYKTDEDLYSYALFADDKCSGYEEPDFLQMPDAVEDLIGPVNGLFCVVGVSRKIALLNPALRQFRPLPASELELPANMFSLDDVIGFGFDEQSGAYKVVSMRYYWQKEKGYLHFPPLVHVYSSATNCWTKYEDMSVFKLEYCAYGSLCKTYLNGVYYWIMEFGDANVAAMLTFDMTTERFEEIQIPDSVKSRIGHLTLYGDSIALLSYDLVRVDKCEIWVMGNEGIWSRLAVLGPFLGVSWPLSFWKNDELLLETEGSFLTLFNVFTGENKTINIRVRENDSFLSWIYRYKESLVSLKGVGNNCMYWEVDSEFIRYLLEE